MNRRFKAYLTLPIVILCLLIGMNISIFFIEDPHHIWLTAMIVTTIVVGVVLFFVLKSRFSQTITDYAIQYGLMQRRLLDEFEVPYALVDNDGKMLWMNQAFLAKTKTAKTYHKSIATLLPGITKELLAKIIVEHHLYLSEEDSFLHIYIRRIFLDDSITTNEAKKAAIGESESVFALYLFDETQLQESLKENEEQKLVTALVYIDNYEEALDSIEEVKRSLLIALVDRKVNQYFANVDGIIKKIEKDKYFIAFKKKYLESLEENRFGLIEDVKTIKIGNEMPITLSIGVGSSSKSFAQNYDYTRAAIDLALGRGGDQAVVKTQEKISYYGGKTEQVEKFTRVKARVKAQALREILEGKEKVIVMGHSFSDIDSFGASIGIRHAANVLGKKAFIVLNEVSSALKPLKNCFSEEKGYNQSMFVNSEEAIELADRNTVVVVVDTNKPSYTECPQLLNQVKTIVVFDHHRQGSEVVNNATLSYIEPYASSTCEMIAEVLQYFSEDVKLDNIEADALYAGMLIDTNSFVTKTGVRTFEAAAYLKRNGADVTRVRKLLRDDMDVYKARAEAVRRAEVYRNDYAISICPGEGLESPTIAGAQASNELLNINGIKASFVLTDFQGKTYISARSIDEVNVQLIMERLGGGGHMNVAGAQLSGMTVEEAIIKLKTIINQMIEEGDI